MNEMKPWADYEKCAPQPARTYKDRVFRMIFKDKEKLLELYNAVNGTNHQNPNDMTVTTLQNAIYINMKNDLSFILYDYLSLYEHQSTRNPNMPLRNLLYISSVYSNLLKHQNLHSTKLVQIPNPKFVVFYNGTDPIPERMEQKLSEAYFHQTEEPELELRVTVLNINLGHNRELAEKCRALGEYMQFVDKVRRYQQNFPLESALEITMEECIREGVLKDFLENNKAEVKSMSIFEFDEESFRRAEREYGRELGHEEGCKETLIRLVCRKLEKSKAPEVIAEELEEELENVEKIIETARELKTGCSWEELPGKILDKWKRDTWR